MITTAVWEIFEALAGQLGRLNYRLGKFELGSVKDEDFEDALQSCIRSVEESRAAFRSILDGSDREPGSADQSVTTAGSDAELLHWRTQSLIKYVSYDLHELWTSLGSLHGAIVLFYLSDLSTPTKSTNAARMALSAAIEFALQMTPGLEVRFHALARFYAHTESPDEIISGDDPEVDAAVSYYDKWRPQDIYHLAPAEPEAREKKELPRLPTLQPRTIDANLVYEKFEPNASAILTITIRLPESTKTGKWHAQIYLDLDAGVEIILETKGFTLLSEPPPPIKLPDDRDTAPVAFILRVDEAEAPWIHAMLMQAGSLVGELTINDFSQFNTVRAQSVSVDFRRTTEPDLTLVMRSSEERIEVSSPRKRACLDRVTMTGFKYPKTSFIERLARHMTKLYNGDSNLKDTYRELCLVGKDVARALPEPLITLLRRPDVKSIMLRHDENFDFPIELAFLDHPDDPFFIGDRIAVSRWYLGVTNPPDQTKKVLKNAAFIKGSEDVYKADEAFLQRLFGKQTETFGTRAAVIESVFKTDTFDLIHFTGHCRENEGTESGLELADGSFLRLADVGELESERKFAKANPFVLLNACASAKPLLGIMQMDSFGHRFVTNQACAVVGTLWPVAGDIATEFAERFYIALQTDTVGRALLSAKQSLVGSAPIKDAELETEDVLSLARQIAVRSYCLFANPDLRIEGISIKENVDGSQE
jgi:hypothetical protein